MNKLTILLASCSILLIACDQTPTDETAIQYRSAPSENAAVIYHLAIHPLHNPQKLFEAYQPLVDYINSQLHDVQIELEASRDYPTYEKKFRAREPELLLPNPWQTLQAMERGYHVIGMAGDADDFKGLFIVRKDSNIKEPNDLKGKVVSYPAATALAAAIMPQYFLYTNGIDINQDLQNIYVGSQESSIMNVYLGKVAAGATWPPPWRLFQKDHPEKAKQLTVIWQTPPLINNSVMVRNDVPEAIAKQIQDILVGLENTSKGQVILSGMETNRIYASNDADYNIVREYIKHFQNVVRPVENQ